MGAPMGGPGQYMQHQQMSPPSTMFAPPPSYPPPGVVQSSYPTTSSYAYQGSVGESREVKVKFLIPVSEVGRAIGKAGATIKEVLSTCEHKVKIQVEKDENTEVEASQKLGVAMRPIHLEGPLHLVHKAHSLLLTKMHGQEPDATVEIIYWKTPAPVVCAAIVREE